MALSIPGLIAASAATTAASTAENKVKAMAAGLIATVLAEASNAHPLDGPTQNKIAAVATEFAANAAEFQTALGL